MARAMQGHKWDTPATFDESLRGAQFLELGGLELAYFLHGALCAPYHVLVQHLKGPLS